MLLLATRHVLPTTPHATRSSHLDSVLFPRVGMRMWGKEVWHGHSTNVPTFPVQKPSTSGNWPAFDILHHYVSSFEMRQQEFSAVQPTATGNDA